MAAIIKQYLCCCLPQTGSDQQQHAQQDERQPLLNPDILPTAPSRPAQRTTEQQQAEQDQLRHILHLAEQRLLSVESSAPFRQPDAAAPSSSSPAPSRSRHRHHHHHAHPSRPDLDHRSHSESSSTTSTVTASASAPRTGSRPSRSSRSRHRSARRRAAHEDEGEGGRGSPSTSRHRVHPAAGDEGAGPLAPVRVVHLDRNTWTELESAPSGARKRNGRSDAAQQRPASSHSMKTLPRSSRPAGLSALDSSEGPSEELTGDEEDDTEADEAREDDSQSTQFGTVGSYRTAREGDWLSMRQSGPGSAGSAGRNGRRHARDLWSHDGAEASSANPEELSQAIERLEQEIETWTLPDHGPFVADLGKSGKNAE